MLATCDIYSKHIYVASLPRLSLCAGLFKKIMKKWVWKETEQSLDHAGLVFFFASYPQTKSIIQSLEDEQNSTTQLKCLKWIDAEALSMSMKLCFPMKDRSTTIATCWIIFSLNFRVQYKPTKILDLMQ